MTARQLFDLLLARVHDLQALGVNHEPAGQAGPSEAIYRACIVLAVAAFDAFVHEKAASVFLATLQATPGSSATIAPYLRANAAELSRPDVASIVRYHLSFKTMTLPDAIDRAMAAGGQTAADIWRAIGVSIGSRESRLRTLLSLQVDRRNQIAHEGDWDPAQLAMRRATSVHVDDCVASLRQTVAGLDQHWR